MSLGDGAEIEGLLGLPPEELKLADTIDEFGYSVAITNDAPSSVSLLDVNRNKTVTAHVDYRPSLFLHLGASFSQGAYLDHEVFLNPAMAGVQLDDHLQRVYGFDLDYARGPFTLFAEAMHCTWDSPMIPELLRVTGFFLEPQYKILPGLSAVLRWEELRFNNIDSALGRTPWEFDVTRVDTGLQYRIERDFRVKVSYQWNRTRTPVPRDPSDDTFQTQFVVTF